MGGGPGSDCLVRSIQILLRQRVRRRAWMARVCLAKAASSAQSIDCQCDTGVLLGSMALAFATSSRSCQSASLSCVLCRHFHSLHNHCLAFQSHGRKHLGGRSVARVIKCKQTIHTRDNCFPIHTTSFLHPADSDLWDVEEVAGG